MSKPTVPRAQAKDAYIGRWREEVAAKADPTILPAERTRPSTPCDGPTDKKRRHCLLMPVSGIARRLFLWFRHFVISDDASTQAALERHTHPTGSDASWQCGHGQALLPSASSREGEAMGLALRKDEI